MDVDIIEEIWAPIPNFSNYQISNLGRVYNVGQERIMRTSLTNHGHVKLSLIDDEGQRHSKSISLLVAECFVESPHILCNQVVLLDGDLSNVVASNLVWRPRWMAWLYVRQQKKPQPRPFHNLPVCDTSTGMRYESIIDAGTALGLLYQDIWDSTYLGKKLFPLGSTFEVIRRV